MVLDSSSNNLRIFSGNLYDSMIAHKRTCVSIKYFKVAPTLNRPYYQKAIQELFQTIHLPIMVPYCYIIQ